jgi:hypothetical protein
MQCLIVFENTHAAIKAEKLLLAADMKVFVVPLPSSVRAGCGISLRVCQDHSDAAQTLLEAEGITCRLVWDF